MASVQRRFRTTRPGPMVWAGGLLGAAVLLTGLSAGLLAGCVQESKRPLKPREEIYDPNPTRRAQAVGELGRVGSDRDVPLLIEALDDQDEAVRMAAGRGLVELTGHDTGYRPYADSSELRRQVDLWRAWHAANTASGGTPR